MPKVANNPLQVSASVWKLGKMITHKEKEYKLNNYEECRVKAEELGYSGIRIEYK